MAASLAVMVLEIVEQHYREAPEYCRICPQELATQRDSCLPFQRYIAPSATVVDFGCGMGGILRSLHCGRRIGIEINESSIVAAMAAGIEVHRDSAGIEDQSADVVISHQCAMEHAQPFQILSELRRVLKPRGLLIVIGPVETAERGLSLVESFVVWESH